MKKSCEISVVLEAFADTPLEEVLSWLSQEVPEVTAVEVGAGGYAPHPHCAPEELLASEPSRRQWLSTLARHDISLDALNVWGNPLHPDPEISRAHDDALRRAILLAGPLGTNTIVAMSGCPAATAADVSASFGAGGWLPYLEGVHDRQWEDRVAPYWAEIADFAARENPDLNLCIELHPGTTVYNVETFEKFTALGPNLHANLDPSHFFWMGMDANKVVERILPRIGHVHAKDTSFNEEALALNGLLDHRWPASPADMPWNFSVPGRGHDEAWWHALIAQFAESPVRSISIEQEDPFVDAKTGVKEAATLIHRALSATWPNASPQFANLTP
ncbi:MAG: sugar phosphate isomerase/epimerase family protein [Isosphaeraceae bacterium]